MAWQDEAIPMLRTILGDAGCGAATYSETRLEELCLASAHLIIQDVPFDTSYTVTISEGVISPDPAEDVPFINFMVLKAACLADEGTYRTKALMAGVEARCGPAILKTMNHIKGFETLLTEGPCKAYEELKQDMVFGNTDVIRAVLSPFRGNDFDPGSQRISDISNGHRDRWFL